MQTNYITKADYKSSIRGEFIDKAIADDQQILEIVENEAIDEMRGYLAARYNVEAEFAKTGDDRHHLVLMFAKDIAIYHLCSIREGLMTQTRIDRYERAVKWLEDVQKGAVTVEGLDRVEEESGKASSEFQMKSNPKRVNRI